MLFRTHARESESRELESWEGEHPQLAPHPPVETKALPPQPTVVLREHAGLCFAQVAAMRAIELLGEIDDQHRLCAQMPEDFPAGSV